VSEASAERNRVSEAGGRATASDRAAGGRGQDVWSAQDTDPDAIDAALRELLRARYAANQTLAPARVINLIVVVDRASKGEIINRLDGVGRYHASRTILCAVEEGRQTLDATAVMTYDERTSGGIGVMHEHVTIDMGPEHVQRLDTVVDPIVISELPTILWCPHGYREAVEALRGMIDVMLLDSDDRSDVAARELVEAAEMLRSAYVVDLAWLRTTPWRERLAASFDPSQRRAALRRLEGIAVRHGPASKASALLLAGWLSSRLHWNPAGLSSANGAGLRGSARKADGQISVALDPVDLEVPGLAGVTVSCAHGFSLALDRARGGLCARERSPDGRERVWQILGASRGEGGILGEGVRQALLRDPTYGPALEAARAFCPA
jgi:glucose-6-phosphate dehydrogenase assembly protein OpcA